MVSQLTLGGLTWALLVWLLSAATYGDEAAGRRAAWPRTKVDDFIWKRLEENRLKPSRPADKPTLIRRATFDLTGLPPTAEEVEEFVADTSPGAYERLIDRLLASPRYGERWGRHWLDVARYADSENDARNVPLPYAWSFTYRDWVISALNEDLPYDRFVLYQLAADRVIDINPRHLAALGFLSLGREFARSYPQTVDDRIDVVTRGFLGLTVSCARCHDHMYDSIPTKDYYALYSILGNLREPTELPLLGKPAPASAKQARYEKRLAQIRQTDHEYRVRRLAERVAFFKSQTAEYLLAARDAAGLSAPQIEAMVRDRQLNLHILSRWQRYLQRSREHADPLFAAWHAAAAVEKETFADRWPGILDDLGGNPLVHAELAATSAASLRDVAVAYATALQGHDQAEPFGEPAADQLRAVWRGPEAPLGVQLDDFKLICSEGDLNNLFDLSRRYKTLFAQAAYDGAAPRAMAVENVPVPVPAHVLIRGNPNNPGPETPPHFLSCLGGSDTQPFERGTGRLELAEAIIAPDNPLTAQVIANRVWMHHFGFGLVRSPSDFGVRGDYPSHPKLLAYLSQKLIQSDWSLKELHRLIMTSAVYQQTSRESEAARERDPENRLLWRMYRRRLEIEGLRDAMLFVAGHLDTAAGGPPFSLTAQPSAGRRTVYGFIERSRIPSMLSTFDFASPEQHAPSRFVTTVPQQALFFLNSPFVAEQARHLAARVAVTAATTPRARIEQLYRLVFARVPTAREVAAGLRFISATGPRDLSATSAGPWRYGTGRYRADAGNVESFRAFPIFSDGQWQGGPPLPAAAAGIAGLTANGGQLDESERAVVRRWISPVAGTVTITGKLSHGRKHGDGVRGRIVSSRYGELGSWSVHRGNTETELSITVERGEVIDFLVEMRSDSDGDRFGWAPVIQGEQTWDAKRDFAGPIPQPLATWERYAQVLLETNEFAFVD